MDRTNLDPGLSVPRPAPDPRYEPRTLGDYRILRRLGEGGMGSVYLGYHEGQGRQVAIKVLSDHLAGNQAYVDRFYREARSGALLNHPNIVRGLLVGQDKATNKHYIVLEFVDGGSALALLEKFGHLSVGDTVHIGLDIARALEHAHSRNIIHRDIKPDNILITRSGVAKLADLGLARRTDEASHLTGTRQGFGTPYYMPYEQAINAKQADARSDIYALGATLYHLVIGEVPFSGLNHLEVMDKKDRGAFQPASRRNPEVPPALDRILQRMLAREPSDRYQTASELIVDLERSRLANPLPSFADPALAKEDPWVQACMSVSAQPTLPDMQAGAPQAPLPANGQKNGSNGAAEVWYLRRQDREGRWRKFRATKQQILDQLRSGQLPARVEASPAADGSFRSLSSYAEFRDVVPLQRRPKKAKVKADAVETAKEQVPIVVDTPPPARRVWPIAVAALAVLSLAALLLYWFGS